MSGRASKGLKQSAGRGEREDQVRGRIEFRGVGLVFPVGGEPGARAKIARSGPAREAAKAGRARVKRELLAETNGPHTTSELLFYCYELRVPDADGRRGVVSFPSSQPFSNIHVGTAALGCPAGRMSGSRARLLPSTKGHHSGYESA